MVDAGKKAQIVLIGTGVLALVHGVAGAPGFTGNIALASAPAVESPRSGVAASIFAGFVLMITGLFAPLLVEPLSEEL